MLTTLEGIILGIVQGLTEFIPVSSSGHLVIAQQWFGMKEAPLALDILLHLATLLATLFVFREKLIPLALASLRLPNLLISSKGSLRSRLQSDREVWLVTLILISTFVTGIIGILFHKKLEEQFSTMHDLWWQFAITGLLLFFARKRSEQTGKSELQATISDALLIGLAQAIAIIPAISRSGATIAAALFLSFSRQLAGEYSFLISIPAIAGAVLLEAKHGFTPMGVTPTGAVGGFIASFILGLISLKLLLGWIRGGRLGIFAYYTLTLAVICFFFR